MLDYQNCQEFIENIPPLNVGQESNILIACVLDCAAVNGELVIYELQPFIRSQVSESFVLTVINSFNHTFYSPSYSSHPAGFITKERAITLSALLTKEKFKEKATVPPTANFYRDQKNIHHIKDNKQNLIIYDTPGNFLCNFLQINSFKQHQGNKNRFWCSTASNLHPIEAIFNLKHMQRLLMSGTRLAPPFVFIEKKEVYIQSDIDEIATSLSLKPTDFIVIKENRNAKGQGNTFLEVGNLLEYLNSEDFRKKYAKDLVILIEQAKNERTHDYYHTHRYGVSYINDDFNCVDIYDETHEAFDSHQFTQITWTDETRNKIEKSRITIQIQLLLHIIRSTDYPRLITRLLSSENSAFILLGIEFLNFIYQMEYIKYGNTVYAVPGSKYSAIDCSIEFPPQLLRIFERLRNHNNSHISLEITHFLKNVVKHVNCEEFINKTPHNMKEIINHLIDSSNLGISDSGEKIFDKNKEPVIKIHSQQLYLHSYTLFQSSGSIGNRFEKAEQRQLQRTCYLPYHDYRPK